MGGSDFDGFSNLSGSMTVTDLEFCPAQIDCCPADVDNDGSVASDILAVLAAFGSCP